MAKNEIDHIRLNETKWDQWAETIDSDTWRHRYLRQGQDRLFSLLDIKEGISLLDVGCGTGRAIGRCAEMISFNGSFYGVDLSLKMIEKANERFRDRNNFAFIKANVESIPLDDKLFDIIICTNSFHHYLHPDRALVEMRRLLKSAGEIYILDPTADTLFVKMIDKIGRLFEPEHVKLYSTDEFKLLFSNAGLQYIRTAVVNSGEKIHIGKR